MRIIITLFVLLLALTLPMYCQASEEKNSNQATDVYEFPIKPGMPEWKELKTQKSKLEVMQIPEAILSEITTSGLVSTCLNYSFLHHIICYNTYQFGIETVISNFNGLQELLNRPEAGSLLTKEYISKDPGDLDPNWTVSEEGEYKFKFMFMEMLLSQEKLLSGLSKEEKLRLLEDCLSKYEAKVKHETYGTMHWKTTAYLMGRILLSVGDAQFKEKYNEDEKLRSLLRDAGRFSIRQLNTIVMSADQYVNGSPEARAQHEMP